MDRATPSSSSATTARSLHAASTSHKGRGGHNLQGGIDAWSVTVDPSVPATDRRLRTPRTACAPARAFSPRERPCGAVAARASCGSMQGESARVVIAEDERAIARHPR